MAYTPYERETNINFSDDSDECYIYTCNRAWITKLNKLCKSNPDIYKLVKEDEFSSSYLLTMKKYVSIRAPKVMSKETTAKLSKGAKDRFSK